MPPKKSRRLPGGKVRRPAGASGARGATRPLPSTDTDDTLVVFDEDEFDDASAGEEALETVASLEDFRVARPAPEPPPPVTSRRIRDRRARGAVVRSGPSPMELAALNYRHIRGDLLRIAIIAAVMFGIIIALSFVVK